MKRFASLAYAVVVYLFFFAVFCYAIGFIADAFVPKSLDSGGRGLPVSTAVWIDLGLLGLFAVQHSLMARPEFKRVWTRLVPAPIERATYVLFTSLVLVALFVYWEPIPLVVWSIGDPLLRSVVQVAYFAAWGLLLWATCMIDHFDLFGVRQALLHFRGRSHAKSLFSTPFLYRFVRHPIYVAWTLIFWLTPTMTAGHALFAAVSTAYILLAIPLEERDLVREFGDTYRTYRATTPALVPGLRRRAASEKVVSA